LILDVKRPDFFPGFLIYFQKLFDGLENDLKLLLIIKIMRMCQ